MSPDTRRALGTHGEAAAVLHLTAAGHRIVARNYRTRHGELDIVAIDGSCLVFCEVKTRVAGGRRGPGGPLEAIGQAKRRRLRLMAREWLADEAARAAVGWPCPADIRFDAIGVTVTASGEVLRLDHVEAAF